MIKFKYIFALFLLILCCYGCGARIPYATTFPQQTQRKMQAAKHWQVLAEDVAEQVKSCIVERRDLMVKPVYVIPKTRTPFEEIFQDILISKLVSGGVLVAKVEKKEVLKLEYNVRLLRHRERQYSKFPLKFTALGAGVMVARGLSDWMMNDLLVLGAGAGLLADVAISHHAGGPSEREAIITTSLSYDDYFFMHQSDIYYINDPDAGHYVEMTEGAELKKEQTKAAMEREREGAPKKALSKKYITEPSEIEEQSKTVVTPSSPQSSEEVVETPEAKNPAAQRRTFNVVD